MQEIFNKEYMRDNLEVFLFVKQSRSKNDVVLETKTYKKIIRKAINNFVDCFYKAGKDFNSLTEVIVKHCSSDELKTQVRDCLEGIKDAFLAPNEELDEFTTFNIILPGYLTTMSNNTMKRLKELTGFADNTLSAYINLWKFSKSRNKRFKEYILSQVNGVLKLKNKELNRKELVSLLNP